MGNDANISKLNPLQLKVMELRSTGLSGFEIAQEMNLSEITIQIILNTAKETLGATSAHQAIVIFMGSKP